MSIQILNTPCALVVGLVLLVQFSSVSAETIFASHTLGVITVGLNEKNIESRRAVALVVSGDDPSGAIGLAQSTECAKMALPSDPKKTADSPGVLLVNELDVLERRFNPTPREMSEDIQKQLNIQTSLVLKEDTDSVRGFAADRLEEVKKQLVEASPSSPEEIEAAAKEEVAASHAAFLTAMKSVNRRLFECNNNMRLRVGVATFACSKSNPLCVSPRYAVYTTPEVRRFARVYSWLRALSGAKPEMSAFAVMSLIPATDPKQVGLGSPIEKFAGLEDVSRQIDPRFLQVEFERLAKYVRQVQSEQIKLKLNPSARMPFVAATVAGIKFEVAIRLSDTIADPVGITTLARDPAANLALLQDEIARSRIKECYYYRGQQTAALVSKCAPYPVSDAQVFDCLSGGACIPKLGDTGTLNALLIAAPKKFDELLKQDLPRLGAIKIDESIVKFANDCKAKGYEGDDLARCALASALPAEFNPEKLAACVKKPASASEAIDRLNCLPGVKDKVSEGAKRAMQTAKCLEDKSKSSTDCLLASSTTAAQAQALYACTSKPTDEERALCAAGSGVLGPKVSDAVACLKSAGGDEMRLAACAGQAFLSEDVSKAIACAKKSTDSVAMAVCVGGDKIPDSIRKPVQCVASAGGNPMGAAVCMAGDGLSEDQRIALQCAASSGGEPNTFAVCAGGQMLLATIVACSKARFAEGPCFGKGNELQKLVNAVFGKEISPNSVVGQIINTNIDAVKLTVASAKSLGKNVERLAHNVEREAIRFDRERRRVERQAAQVVGGGIDIVTKPLKNLLRPDKWL